MIHVNDNFANNFYIAFSEQLSLMLLTDSLPVISWYCITIDFSLATQALASDGNWSRNDL